MKESKVSNPLIYEDSEILTQEIKEGKRTFQFSHL